MEKSKKTKRDTSLVNALLIVAFTGLVMHIKTRQEKEEILKIKKRIQKKEINVYRIAYNALLLIVLLAILIMMIIKQ